MAVGNVHAQTHTHIHTLTYTNIHTYTHAPLIFEFAY